MMKTLNLTQKIRDVPHFPRQGIIFKDITPLLQDAAAFRAAIDRLAEPFRATPPDLIIGVESRGFIFGTPLAMSLSAGFIPVRKAGKLPSDTFDIEYALEYGMDKLSMHRDAVSPGQKVLVVDDLLATGGTAEAVLKLLQRAKAEVLGFAFLIELLALQGRGKLAGVPVVSVIQYE